MAPLEFALSLFRGHSLAVRNARRPLSKRRNNDSFTGRCGAREVTTPRIIDAKFRVVTAFRWHKPEHVLGLARVVVLTALDWRIASLKRNNGLAPSEPTTAAQKIARLLRYAGLVLVGYILLVALGLTLDTLFPRR